MDLRELSWFDGKIFADPSSRLLYSSDQSQPPAFARKFLTAEPILIAQPNTIEACSQLLAHLDRVRIPVVPRGAASFALGGAVLARAGVVLDLSPRRRVLRLDKEAMTVEVEGGCRWSDLSEYLEPHGLDVFTCPTSAFSTVAGWVATGGAGIGTLKYGLLRGLVEELEVILPGGSIRRLTAGDPELELMFGSEGELGVIWSVRLRVRTRQRVMHPVLIPCEDLEAATALVSDACRFSPYAITLYNAARMAIANREHKMLPEKPAVLAVYEQAEEAWGFQQHLASRGVATSPRGVASFLWNERFFPIRMKKYAPGMLAADVVVPRRRLARYLAAAEAAGRSHGVDVFCEASFDTPESAVTIPSFFSDPRDHIGYALHGYLALTLARRAISLGGHSYGHGLWYSLFKDRGEDARRRRALKRRLDPHGLFNPSKSLAPSIKLSAWNALTRGALSLSSVLLRLNGPLSRARSVRLAPPTSVLRKAIEACSSCGSCLSKCPAYIETADERTTARGKLKMAAAILSDRNRFAAAEEKVPFLCMHCKFCTEVCQSDIPLEDVYTELEHLLAARVDYPEAEVAAFVTSIESKGLMRALGLAPPALANSAHPPIPRRPAQNNAKG